MTTKQISEEVEKTYIYDKFKSLCEIVADLELQVEYLKSEEGQEMAGSEPAKETLNKLKMALTMRKAEKRFLEKKIGV